MAWGSEASLLAPTAPGAVSTSDHPAISIGTRITSSTAGRVTAIRWYCPAGWANPGTVHASLYRSAGDRAAYVALASPVAGTWNRIELPEPVELPASSWTVSMWLPTRTTGADYAFTAARFASPVTSGDLVGSAGAFDYSVGSVYPSNTTTTFFGVDVVWQTGLPDSGEIPTGYPTQTDTGPASGVTLTNYAGPTTIPSGTYTGKRFPALSGTGFYDSDANDLTFTDCEFLSGVVFRGDRLVVERTRIAGGISLSGVNTATLSRLDVHHSGTDLVHITSDTGQCRDIHIADSILSDPTPIAGAHSDGIQVRGVQGLTIERCAIDMGPWVLVSGGEVLNAALFLQNAQGGNRDVRVEDCYLNGAGFTLVSDVVAGTSPSKTTDGDPKTTTAPCHSPAPRPPWPRTNADTQRHHRHHRCR